MTEIATGCNGVGQVEMRGQVIARDIEIFREGKTYIISVATPSYVEDIRLFNQKLVLEDQIEDNNYVLNDVSSVPNICEHLSALSLEELQPFLTEQILSPDESEI